MIIRKAKREDIQDLLDIYNYEVVNGIATLDLNPKTLDEWELWFQDHQKYNRLLLAADIDGQPVGYATLSAYREKEAFKSTVELSVYVSPDHRHKGIATKLMEEVISAARKDERIHLIVSVITSDNEISKQLHVKFGFTYSGTLHQVGFKHGNFRDIDNYELLV